MSETFESDSHQVNLKWSNESMLGSCRRRDRKRKCYRLKITAMPTIVWSDYIKYRAKLRRFSLEKIEEILRYSSERYFDNGTHRMVVVGKHDNRLVIIPYDKDDDTIVPVTIHTIARQQIRFRLRSGRFTK